MPKKKKTKKIKILRKTKSSKIKIQTKLKLKAPDKKTTVLGPDDKPKIKKIKKQPTEKRIYNVNDHVVYPKHGVGKIMSVEKAVIGDIDINFYKVFIDKDKLTLTIPINQQSNLRHIYSINQMCLRLDC